ncbi:MAG: hypothetical protein Q7U73_10290 [Rubrivivax sp.]|nr:hypothetical protein [Rubrivivax sp.]
MFTSGPFLGQSVAGHFSFDDSLAVPGAIHQGTGVITDLAFAFEGVDYDETDAPLAGLIFNAAGNLSSFLFGNHCALTDVLTCSSGPPLPGSWFVSRSVIAYAGLNAQPGDPTISFALNPVWGPAAAVPEPDTLALLLAAFAALPLAQRFRASRSLPPAAATS